MPILTTSDLIFSDQANHNFSKTLGALKKSTLSIHNRLQSIQQDAAFAKNVANAYNRPLIANERCGSWYIDPHSKAGSAYFKSTDGHTGVWKFSTRRLNFHLLEIIGNNDGCIIVDSTRRGKRMPDALSKTIPIWCSVLNSFLFPSETQAHGLYTPPQVVSQSEHAQIAELLPNFRASMKALNISLDGIRAHISKPLRPIWVTPESHINNTSNIFTDFHPVICCTVSRRVTGGEISEGGYIQGAGDDTENWAYGLTPALFWEHKTELLTMPEAELPNLIQSLIQHKAASSQEGNVTRSVKPTSYLFVAPVDVLATDSNGEERLIISLLPKATENHEWQTNPNRFDVGLGPNKLGSKKLRLVLPFVVEFVEKTLYPTGSEKSFKPNKNIIIVCETGRDHSIGVALALACILFSDDGSILSKDDKRPNINKDFIRRRLSWFSTSLPDANPSRATLQSVNSYLMERPG